MNGLYSAKDGFSGVLSPITKFAVKAKISPDLFTFAGMAGAALAAWGVLLLDPITVLVGLIIRLAGANLDGEVARARKLKNPLGFFANELGDRISDFTVMLAFVLVAMETLNTVAVLATLVATLLATSPTTVSLYGYRLQKSKNRENPIRINGGPLGKTERCALAFLAVLAIRVALVFTANAVVAVLIVFSLIVTLGSIATAAIRARKIRSIITQADPQEHP